MDIWGVSLAPVSQNMALTLQGAVFHLSLVLDGLWQAQFGGKVMKGSENVRKHSEFGWCPHIHQVIHHLSPVTGKWILHPKQIGCLGQSSWPSENTKIASTFSSWLQTCLSKMSFKVQSLFQQGIPKQIFKDAILMYLMTSHGNRMTLENLQKAPESTNLY